MRPVLLTARAGEEPAGDPRLAAHPEQRVLSRARSRNAHLGGGGHPVGPEVLARQPERQRPGQGRAGPADDAAEPGQQPAFGPELTAHQPEHRVQPGALGHRREQQPAPAKDPGHLGRPVAAQPPSHLLGDGGERGLGRHREQREAVPPARLDHLVRHRAQGLPRAERGDSRPDQGRHEPVGVAGRTAPDQAGQHQVPGRQVTAGVGQVGGVHVPDGPVHARDVGQQPEAADQARRAVP